MRVLELRMRKNTIASTWVDGLRALLKTVPRPSPPAYTRWALSCIAGSGDRAVPGSVRMSEILTVLRRANASASVGSELIEQTLRAVEESEEQEELPPWLASAAAREVRTHDQTQKLLSIQQVVSLLLRLCTSSATITQLFHRYAVGDKMGLSQWLSFVSTEQLASQLDESGSSDSGGHSHSAEPPEEVEVELTSARRDFERAIQSWGVDQELDIDQKLSLLQFALLLLSPQNDAVEPARDASSTDDLHAPITHYWVATSHNSYIVGDQLTGISTADAYRRQLLQVVRPDRLCL